VIKELTKIANELDERGLAKEADSLDKLIVFAAFNPRQKYKHLMRHVRGNENPYEAANAASVIEKLKAKYPEIDFESSPGLGGGAYSSEPDETEDLDWSDFEGNIETAWKVRDLSERQALYRLSKPMAGYTRSYTYVVVSIGNTTAWTPLDAYIFGSNKAGKIVDWTQLPASMRDTSSHAEVLKNAGYRIAPQDREEEASLEPMMLEEEELLE